MIDQKFKRTKKLQKAIKLNLKRRTVIVDDQLVYHEGVPTPSWIELSIIDVCNRSCSFCPKADPKIAPNTYQKMTMSLVEKLTNDLKKINYQGSVTLCGYGEPMLHKGVFEMSKKLAEAAFVEIVTNGDTLKSDTINKLYNSNVNKLLISLYDGPDQVTKFKKMAKEAKVPEDFVILRDRWHGSDKDYGLKLTNRTGTIDIGNQDSIGTFTYCNYPSYSVLIDWNGDVFLCPQDWQRKMTTGNIEKEDFFEIWTGSTISKFRKNLLEGNRCDKPCTECNAEGTVLGKNHASAWKKIYKKNI
jgi:radical SAM protein with 4Fe4S-binding SPASM domain|tara:strand:+ start:2922 stop:3824 length:903 start_codon:yes stop_codon:yes gene_type:complete